jgi:hypothetical protein
MIDDREREQIEAILDMIAKDEATSDLAVEVRGGEIIITKAGTDFSVTYEKRPENPHFILTRSWIAPNMSSATISQFRALAFQMAVAKARELRWIV